MSFAIGGRLGPISGHSAEEGARRVQQQKEGGEAGVLWVWVLQLRGFGCIPVVAWRGLLRLLPALLFVLRIVVAARLVGA